jgi:hypothetical protein
MKHGATLYNAVVLFNWQNAVDFSFSNRIAAEEFASVVRRTDIVRKVEIREVVENPVYIKSTDALDDFKETYMMMKEDSG